MQYSHVPPARSVNAPYSVIMFILKASLPVLYTYPVLLTTSLPLHCNKLLQLGSSSSSQCVSLQNDSALLEANIIHFIGRVLVSSALWPKIFSHAFNPEKGKRPNGPPEI